MELYIAGGHEDVRQTFSVAGKSAAQLVTPVAGNAWCVFIRDLARVLQHVASTSTALMSHVIDTAPLQ